MNVELEKLAEQIRICEKCPLAEGRLYAVPGSGSGKSGIVFIGEGPGAREDKIGEPFVGAAGKFLDEMLADIGLKRADVFITNIVKCRPPNNRDPLPDEVKICTENFLWKQLEILNPKVIITLGRHAMHRFIPSDKKIGEVHGMLFHLTSPKTDKKFNILPLYHPAAALYNGGLRKTLKEDFQNVPKIIKEL
ncbi:uracil-DNA glycosylase family protein [Patescibacteria group bacterium]